MLINISASSLKKYYIDFIALFVKLECNFIQILAFVTFYVLIFGDLAQVFCGQIKIAVLLFGRKNYPENQSISSKEPHRHVRFTAQARQGRSGRGKAPPGGVPPLFARRHF
ncbi:MAG: hypothetical protein LBV80_08650 [Deltaproteobacteria bacterium]|nr:hypothetical protein [Deltaproteobacteria bacterium]